MLKLHVLESILVFFKAFGMTKKNLNKFAFLAIMDIQKCKVQN